MEALERERIGLGFGFLCPVHFLLAGIATIISLSTSEHVCALCILARLGLFLVTCSAFSRSLTRFCRLLPYFFTVLDP